MTAQVNTKEYKHVDLVEVSGRIDICGKEAERLTKLACRPREKLTMSVSRKGSDNTLAHGVNVESEELGKGDAAVRGKRRAAARQADG